MSERVPRETTNQDGSGNPPLPWDRAMAAITSVQSGPDVTWFLGVAEPDGSPHAAGVGALMVESELYFQSGPGTRKSRDLAQRPAASLSVHLGEIDLVFEGSVVRVTDAPTLERVAAVYRDGGWPVEVVGDGFTAPFNAPSAGPPPWHLYRFDFHTVYGTATREPWGASRWRF